MDQATELVVKHVAGPLVRAALTGDGSSADIVTMIGALRAGIEAADREGFARGREYVFKVTGAVLAAFTEREAAQISVSGIEDEKDVSAFLQAWRKSAVAFHERETARLAKRQREAVEVLLFAWSNLKQLQSDWTERDPVAIALTDLGDAVEEVKKLAGITPVVP